MDRVEDAATYRAMVVDKPLPDARPEAILRRGVEMGTVPADALEVDVLYSSVNYKDAVALTGGSGILKATPMVPGIDVVGRVRQAQGEWAEGDVVIVNGAGLGERTDGGLAERSWLPLAAAVSLPDTMTARSAAALGTAGFTAALSVQTLATSVAPEDGEILVTGAGGGVGMFAVALLAARGYRVVAATGRGSSLGDTLRALGAERVVGREEIGSEVGKPLQSAQWAGAVDAVGGATLVNVLAQTRYGGVVTACGLAQGADLPGTVLPFILRGVTLAGINSVDASSDDRKRSWTDLAALDDAVVGTIAPRTEPLERAVTVARDLLAGRVAGRVVIDVRA